MVSKSFILVLFAFVTVAIAPSAGAVCNLTGSCATSAPFTIYTAPSGDVLAYQSSGSGSGVGGGSVTNKITVASGGISQRGCLLSAATIGCQTEVHRAYGLSLSFECARSTTSTSATVSGWVQDIRETTPCGW